jgi:uncharacterized membrane protein YgcG
VVAVALTTRRDADLLERLLTGERVPSAPSELVELARTAAALPRPRVGPDPLFVARLRSQLAEQAQQAPRRTPAEAPTPRRARRSERVLVLRVPRALITGAVAAIAGLAVLVGGLSTQALPGDRLYPVKLELGQARVRLAGSDLDRGRVLLGQVSDRLDEATALVAAGDANPVDVAVALDGATASLAQAQRVLVGADGGPGAPIDPEALRALSDASAQATGRLAAIAPMLPSAAAPAAQRLVGQLRAGVAALGEQLAACGAPCAELLREMVAAGRLRTVPGTAVTGGPVPVGGIGDGTGAGAPGAGPTSSPGRGGAGSGSSTGSGGSTGSGSGPTGLPTGLPIPAPPAGGSAPGAPTAPRLTLPGATASLPGVSVSVPRVTVTTSGSVPVVSVPPVSISAGPVTAGVTPSQTTGGCVVTVTGVCIG